MANSNSKHSFRILLLFTFLIPFSFLNFALGNVNKTSSSDIELSGKLDECSLRSSGSEILAFQESASIIFSPMININNITIEITDESDNVVFSDIENLKYGENIVINISDLAKGSYSLSIESCSGGSLTGGFDIR